MFVRCRRIEQVTEIYVNSFRSQGPYFLGSVLHRRGPVISDMVGQRTGIYTERADRVCPCMMNIGSIDRIQPSAGNLGEHKRMQYRG